MVDMPTVCPPCGPAAEKGGATGGSTVICMACRVRVSGSKALRAHYQSEYHRINLSRKVLGLEPLTLEEVNIRIAHARAEEAAKVTKESVRRRDFYCTVCSKRFSSEKALENHCKSRRHLDAVRARPMSEVTLTDGEGSQRESERDEPIDEQDVAAASDEEEEEIDEDALKPTVCPFDGHESASMEDNAKYMASEFGFFIPYIEALVDMEGLFEYLNIKVARGFICVNCDKQFNSVDAVRRHMVAKQHCSMTDHDEVWADEYAEFYDFDREVGELDGEDDEGWVEVGDDEEIPEDAVVIPPELRKQQALEAVRPVLDAPEPDDEHVSLVVNGKVLGHRSLKRYYGQSYAAGGNKALVAHVKREYLALGVNGNEELANAVRKKQLARKRRLELKASKAKLRESRRQRFELRVGKSNLMWNKARRPKASLEVLNSGHRF